jgi:GGDEF domain-containing protein
VIGAAGVEGVVSRMWVDMVAASPAAQSLRARPCIEFADRGPIKVESDLDLAALTAMLVESDVRRMSDGFVILSKGRYLGMGTCRDVMRTLQSSRVLAARYTNPLTLLPGQVPINEHLDRLLERRAPFTAWFVEIDQMRGLNDTQGFAKGDAIIHATAELLEEACAPGLDFVGHISGSRFMLLAQSEDWESRAHELLGKFTAVVESHLPPRWSRAATSS